MPLSVRPLVLLSASLGSVLIMTGCGTHTAAAHTSSSPRSSSHVTHSVKTSTSHAPQSLSSPPSSASISAAFGSAAWSQALQAQLAQRVHDASIVPLDIVPMSPQWGAPAHSVLIWEPLAVHQQFYYAVVQKNHPVHWQHFSNHVTTISSAIAQKVPEPLFWSMHFAMLLQQGVQEPASLGNTIPWDTIAGNVGNPVAIAGYYFKANYGQPASLSITAFVPMQWKNPQDAGIAAVSLPNGHLVDFAVSAPITGDTWQIQQSFYAVAPQDLSQDLPQTPAQGDFLLPHAL